MKSEGYVTCLAYDEKNKIFGLSSTDKYLHFYQKTKMKIEYLKSIPTKYI